MGVAIAGYVVPSCGLFEYHHRDEDVSTTSSHSYPDGLKGVHHASIGMFRYHVLEDGASSSCDYYSTYFFYNPNPSIFISQICGLGAPILGLFGVVLQLFAKTYRSFANLLWLFAFGAQLMTWSLVFDASFCFQKGDKAFATCTVTFDGYSNMLAALFFLVAYIWSLTCYRKTVTQRPEHMLVMESPKIDVSMGISESDLFEVSDEDISLPNIQITEAADETIDDDEDPNKEREGLDGEVVDMQGQVVKELVEHKRFQEQGMKVKIVEKEDLADVESAAPEYSSDVPSAASADV
jgi:hypothetical protein